MGSDSGNTESMIQFERFDVVAAEPTDHYYYLNSNNSEKSKKSLNNNANATIMKEWRILSKNLPDSIFVRVYETRIDLLRAVIVGPAGTPYHDGLFFFDILLPYDYPKQPPKVYYRSHGYRLNPNLYHNGKVCLSLINTWGGKKTEKWTKESTVLQILVSIQGLVLTERPYFNEPGFRYAKDSKSSKWIKRSIEYSEDAFVLSCTTMLHIMRKPPQNFEDFVARHFRERAASILAAIKDYHEGRVLVGQFQMNNNNNGQASTSSSSSFKASSKFKENLIRLHARFKKAFPDVHSEPINMDISTDNNNVKKKKKKKALPSSSSSSGTNSKINNGEKEKPNKKGFFGKIISSFGKCLMQ